MVSYPHDTSEERRSPENKRHGCTPVTNPLRTGCGSLDVSVLETWLTHLSVRATFPKTINLGGTEVFARKRTSVE